MNSEAGGGGYGQNIAAGVNEEGVDRVITDMFYNGEVNWYDGLYGQASPSMVNFEHWGHFSQIVWKSTTQVGCATQYCPNGLGNTGSNVPPYFTVCNYKGPGMYHLSYFIPPTHITNISPSRQHGWRIRRQRPQAARTPHGLHRLLEFEAHSPPCPTLR